MDAAELAHYLAPHPWDRRRSPNVLSVGDVVNVRGVPLRTPRGLDRHTGPVRITRLTPDVQFETLRFGKRPR